MIRTCEVCGAEKVPHWRRCEEHYRCDDCGTRQGLCMYCEGVLCDTCHTTRVEKRIAEFDGDCDDTHEIVCPHCGYTVSDSWEFSEGEQLCGDCNRIFEMTRHTEVTYSTKKVGARA